MQCKQHLCSWNRSRRGKPKEDMGGSCVCMAKVVSPNKMCEWVMLPRRGKTAPRPCKAKATVFKQMEKSFPVGKNYCFSHWKMAKREYALHRIRSTQAPAFATPKFWFYWKKNM